MSITFRSTRQMIPSLVLLLLLAACGSSASPQPADGSAVDAPSSNDARVADASRPDASRPDASRPDASRPDASLPDASRPDASLPDRGAADAPADGAPSDSTNGASDLETTDTSTRADSGSHPNAPRILSLTANPLPLTPTTSTTITALVTDPDGVADVIGGVLLQPGAGVYGSFKAGGGPGTFLFTIDWKALDKMETIGFSSGGIKRLVRAEFFDQAGHRGGQDLSIELRCDKATDGACAGACRDLSQDVKNCGECGRSCPSVPNGEAVCSAGKCETRCRTNYHACGNSCLSDFSPQSCGNRCTPCAAPKNGTAECRNSSCWVTCDAGHRFCNGECPVCPANANQTYCGSGNVCLATTCADGFYPCAGGCCAWSVETVDNFGDVGKECRLIIDDKDTLHLLYQHTAGSIYYATKTSAAAAWNREVAAAGWGGLGLTLDANRSPHISYWDGSYGSEIRYAARSAGGSWKSEVIDRPHVVLISRGTSVAIHPITGEPHVAYQTYTLGLRYAQRKAQTWSNSLLDRDSSTPTLAFAQDGTLFLGYHNWDFDFVMFGPYPSAQSIATSSLGNANHFVLDSKGHAHVAYVVGSGVRYAHNGSGKFVIETVPSSGDGERYVSIAIDSDEQPHIAYYDAKKKGLRYARRLVNGKWQTSTPVVASNVGTWPSIGVDSNDRPYIAFYDAGNTQVMLVWQK
jgi:hypothetical protein